MSAQAQGGPFADRAAVMRRALDLAARGMGSVEPNPPVGAVLVDSHLRLVGEGFHARFGGPHAEIEAIQVAGARASGATLFVTLEPCCHHGKTGPCTEAILRAGIRKVFVAVLDPFPEVNGRGVSALRSGGIEVEVGLLASEAEFLAAPFLKLVSRGQPWVHAKWAMTLDGKTSTRSGDSRWISSTESRVIVHELRGRMDAIVVGARTAAVDDPLLTARPAGPRKAARIVVDSKARLSLTSQLVRTVKDAPVIVATSSDAPDEEVRRLQAEGVEVRRFDPRADLGVTGGVDLGGLLTELGRRRMTNVLVEGGARLLGSFFDAGLVDEAHVFIAPAIVGGEGAPSGVAGRGVERMELAGRLESVAIRQVGGDVYLNGRWPRAPR